MSSKIRLSARIVITIFFWLFILISFYLFCSRIPYKHGFILAVLLVVASLWMLGRKKYNSVFLPKGIYQIYFVSAPAKKWSKVLLSLSVMAWVVLIVESEDLRNKPYSIEDMNMVSGKIEKFHLRTSWGEHWVVINTSKNVRMKLRNRNLRKQSKELKRARENNDFITVWYVDEFRLDRSENLQIKQIELFNKRILKYSKEAHKIIYRRSYLMFLFSLLYIVFSYSLIFFYFQKKR